MRKTAFSLGKSLLAISICVLLVALTACGGGGTPAASSAPASATPPAASATPPTSAAPAASYAPYTPPPKPPELPATPTGPPLKGTPIVGSRGLLLAPKPGVWASNSVYSQVDVGNIYIVTRNATNIAGQGHIDFYLDMDIPITTGKKAGVLPSPLPDGFKGKVYIGDSISVQQTQSYTWSGVSNGNHTFGAQVVQNDDTPFNPPIWAKVEITVQGPTPAAKASPSPSPSPK